MSESAAWLSSPLAIVAAAMFGALWGSFFNVCIDRVPAGRSVVRPGSRCDGCGVPVRSFDNVPILSYFWLRGRCRACGAPFSARHPLVEALGAVLAGLLWWKLVTADPDGAVAVRLARFVLYFTFSGVLVVLAFIDLETLLLPDVITLPSIVVFFLAAAGAHDASWAERAIGGAAGYGLIWGIAELYYRVFKREGMGLGDGKLLALIGVVFGWKALPLVIFSGALLGSLVSIPVLLIARRRPRAAGEAEESLRDVQVPFGPFLVAAALLYLFEGRALLLAVAGGAWS